MGVLVYSAFMHIVVKGFHSGATLAERPLKAPPRPIDAGTLDVASGANRGTAPEGAGHLFAGAGAADPRSCAAAMPPRDLRAGFGGVLSRSSDEGEWLVRVPGRRVDSLATKTKASTSRLV